jgi:hypothetical protein
MANTRINNPITIVKYVMGNIPINILSIANQMAKIATRRKVAVQAQ